MVNLGIIARYTLRSTSKTHDFLTGVEICYHRKKEI
jgi:hypothetical protein